MRFAWLVEKSGRKIDLNRIWEKHWVPESLADAIVNVGKIALEFRSTQSVSPARHENSCHVELSSCRRSRAEFGRNSPADAPDRIPPLWRIEAGQRE